MVVTIARKEITEMLRDGRFRWSAGIVLVLLAGSLVLGWHHYSEVHAQHEFARKATREQWLNQGDKNPHSAAHYGVYAFKPKMPLSLIDRGLDPYVGVATWLEAHTRNEFKFKPAQDATAVQRLGELTAAAALQLLVPLTIILLVFPVFAGERDQGTLRQLLSMGVAPERLAAGKALGVACVLAMVLVPATAIGVGALTLASADGFILERLFWMALGYLLYFGIFVGVALAASAWARSSSAALVVLLGFWIFNGLVAPKAAADLARKIHPTPSAIEFAGRIERDLQFGIDGHNPADRRLQNVKARLLKQYGVARVEELPVNFAGIAMQESEEYGERVFDRHYSALWATFDRQHIVHEAAAAMAPLLAVRAVSMAFAGTDYLHHVHFSEAAEEYRRQISRAMNLDLAYNQKGDGAEYLRGRNLWEQVPPFFYSAPDTRWVLARQTRSLLVLLAWALAGASAAWVVTSRLRPEQR